MAGRGAPPKDPAERRNRTPPAVEWRSPAAVGWQHGERPACPAGLLKPSREAWATWMGAWFAAFWTPDDLPGLRQVIRLYDQLERGEFQRAAELRLSMDTYGITPKGQQDRRWKRPDSAAPPASGGEPTAGSRYRHLRPA